MLPAPALLAVGLVIGLIILLPARRLQLAGFSGRSIALYAICLWGLAFFLAVRPFAARFLIPILLDRLPGAVRRRARAAVRDRDAGQGARRSGRTGLGRRPDAADQERHAAREADRARVSGPIALHGGGEFLAGDEEFLAALLARAIQRAERGRPIRVAVVPTAAARGRPDLAGRNGVEAFERVGAEAVSTWPPRRSRW